MQEGRDRVMHCLVRGGPNGGKGGAARQLDRQRPFPAHTPRVEPGLSSAGQAAILGEMGKRRRDPAGLNTQQRVRGARRPDRGRHEMTRHGVRMGARGRVRQARNDTGRGRGRPDRSQSAGAGLMGRGLVRMAPQDRGQTARHVAGLGRIIRDTQSREQPREAGHANGHIPVFGCERR